MRQGGGAGVSAEEVQDGVGGQRMIKLHCAGGRLPPFGRSMLGSLVLGRTLNLPTFGLGLDQFGEPRLALLKKRV